MQLRIAPYSGLLAVAFAAGVIVIAFAAVALRAGGGFALGPDDIAAIRFTLHQAFWSAVISVACAIPVARALARRRFAGRNILVLLLGAPFILPVVTAVLGLLIVFGRSGWVSAGLAFFGFEPISIYGFHGVVLAHVFFNLPLATRLILSAWLAVPAERFRLAAQLGLPATQVFRIIELPVLRQSVPGAFALIFVLCLTSFAVALTLGGGPRATTIELAIYEAFRFEFDLGRAAVLSVVQVAIASTAAALALWLVPRIALGGGLDRRVARWDAQSWLLRLQDGAVILGASAFLIVPLAAIILRGLGGLTDMPPSIATAALTSVIVALASTAIMLSLALPIAGWMAARAVSGAEAIGILALAASPLMIGTGWFLVIFPFADPADFALAITALVNALVALPFALRILLPGMRETVEVYGRLSQALSLQGWRLWRIVLLPRARAPLGFASGLTAALSVGDLGVITLFSDPDRVTLPLAMYRLSASYRTDAAAGAALLLLCLALLAFWAFDAWGRRNA